MKYTIVAAALFTSVLANPAWAPPAYGTSDDSWGTTTSSEAAPSYPAETSWAAASSSEAAPSYPTDGWSSAAAPVYSSEAWTVSRSLDAQGRKDQRCE